MKRLLLALSASLGVAPSAPAQNCAQTSVGLTPLPELGTGTYQGFVGGLWPGGSNARPASHEAAGLALAAEVVPRDASGAPDPAGAIVFLSIGMSNATQEFSTFVPLALADPLRAPAVRPVDGAQGGVAIEDMDDPAAPYWTTTVPARLAAAGVTPEQVQVVWLKNANRMPTDPFPQHALALREQYELVLNILRDTFPNLRLCYLASRIYGGYATTALNPEPFAYEHGFALQRLIADQLAGDPGLSFDPASGPVEAPWLSWGTYNWADGLVPSADGLTWECADFQADGTHPGPSGRQKVAQRLLAFLHADPTAVWYRAGAPPDEPGTPFCFGDGSAGACPCGNLGAPGRGCDNAAATGGALLEGSGSPAAGTVVLEGSGFPPAATPTVIVIRSASLAASPVPFGDGLRCVAAPVQRLAASFAAGGQSTHPLSHGIGPGVFHYQLWYRSSAAFCAPAPFNLSNGYTIVWP
jgi:hypothetical protein